jgi:hypothetical protein
MAEGVITLAGSHLRCAIANRLAAFAVGHTMHKTVYAAHDFHNPEDLPNRQSWFY